jgi:hypothetical protein
MIPPGPVSPQATLHNYGSLRESCRAYFLISGSSAYVDSIALPLGLPLGVDTLVSFGSWTAAPGSYAATCSLYLGTEQVPADNVLTQGFSVGAVDVAVRRIYYPVGNIDTSLVVIPSALAANEGQFPASFTALFRILDSVGLVVHVDAETVVGLAPGETTRMAFAEWPKPHPKGRYEGRCSAYVAYDIDPVDNVAEQDFRIVTPLAPYGWTERLSLPTGAKAIKDGGWLAHGLSDEGIFGARGNKTPDFYCYEPSGDTWHRLASIPAGVENKPPYKGAVGVSDGAGLVYATKGNNTVGFWKYFYVGDSWQQKRPVPLGSSGKKVKAGADLAYALGCVYCLKGQRDEFWRYSPEGDSWTPLPSAPAGGSGGKWPGGSWLCFSGDSLIYAHKAKYHEFYVYNINGNVWARLPNAMPRQSYAGKSKKAKDGSSAAWRDGAIYSFKGGNTQEFWKYVPGRDSWRELETIPAFGSTGKRKKVKAGGDLTATEDLIYALKGNKCNEFWRYLEPPAVGGLAASMDPNGAVASEPTSMSGDHFSIAPNPFVSGYATLTYPSRLHSPLRLCILDVSGREVLRRSVVPDNRGCAPLDLGCLSAGVYLARVTAAGRTETRKLVLQR